MSYAAFFDLLGTKAKIEQKQLSALVVLDFAGAPAVLAIDFPKLRFAVFSDSVIITCEDEDIDEFIIAVCNLMLMWSADWIHPRGGIAHGEVSWIDDAGIDHIEKIVSNYVSARIYGKALIEAVELESKSGPGAVVFLSDESAEKFNEKFPGSAHSSMINILNWATKKDAEIQLSTMEILANKEPLHKESRRQFIATHRFWKNIIRHGAHMPDSIRIHPSGEL